MSNPGLSFRYLTVSIASGATGLSLAVPLDHMNIVRIIMPETWVAANLTFQTLATDGTTWNNAYDQFGAEVTVTAAQARDISISPLSLPTAKQIKVRSGTSGTPVDQTAPRTLTLVCREYE